jgi:hypothetical protein
LKGVIDFSCDDREKDLLKNLLYVLEIDIGCQQKRRFSEPMILSTYIVSNQHAGPDTPILTMLLHVPLAGQADYARPSEFKDSKQYALYCESKVEMLSEEALPWIVKALILRIDPEWEPNHRPLWWPLILGFPIQTTEGELVTIFCSVY